MAEADLTAQKLRELMEYNAESGVFTWISGRLRGKTAGGPQRDGYWRIKIDGGFFRAHRLAWLYCHGSYPTKFLDHINGDRTDNRICNLRPCGYAENQQNIRKPQRRSKTGFLGVTVPRRKTVNKFLASIGVDGKSINLGVYDTPEEAHAAYLKAKRELHPFGTL